MRKDFGGSGEMGVLKDKIFKAKYEDKLEFPEGLGGGGQTKNKIGYLHIALFTMPRCLRP